MHPSQLAQREFITQQPVRIRLSDVAGPEVIDSESDDVEVVVGHSPRGFDWHEPGRARGARRKLIEPNHIDVRNRKYPPALVTMRVVKHVQLAGTQTTHISFSTQRPVDGVGQRL